MMTYLFSSFRWPGALLVALLMSTSAVAGELVEQAKVAIQNGQYAEAVDILHAEVKQGGSEQAWFLLGVAYARKQQFHQAIEAFRQVIQLNPTLAEPHNNLAVIYNELGDVRAAVAELEKSLEKSPGYVVAEENLAELYLKLALRYYKSALDRAPTPELKQRYTRLLHVRDPHPAGPDTVEVAAAEQPVDAAPAVQVATETKPKMVEEVAKAQPSPAPEAAADDKAGVLAAIESWRAAWSARDMDGYLSAYADDFTPSSRFASQDEWKAYKHRVITGKQYIHVELADIQVQFDADNENRATVRFLQSFRSDTYNGEDKKVLLLERHGDSWKISKEDSVS